MLWGTISHRIQTTVIATNIFVNLLRTMTSCGSNRTSTFGAPSYTFASPSLSAFISSVSSIICDAFQTSDTECHLHTLSPTLHSYVSLKEVSETTVHQVYFQLCLRLNSPSVLRVHFWIFLIKNQLLFLIILIVR